MKSPTTGKIADLVKENVLYKVRMSHKVGAHFWHTKAPTNTSKVVFRFRSLNTPDNHISFSFKVQQVNPTATEKL